MRLKTWQKYREVVDIKGGMATKGDLNIGENSSAKTKRNRGMAFYWVTISPGGQILPVSFEFRSLPKKKH